MRKIRLLLVAALMLSYPTFLLIMKYYDIKKLLEFNNPITIVFVPKGEGKRKAIELEEKKHDNDNKTIR